MATVVNETAVSGVSSWWWNVYFTIGLVGNISKSNEGKTRMPQNILTDKNNAFLIIFQVKMP